MIEFANVRSWFLVGERPGRSAGGRATWRGSIPRGSTARELHRRSSPAWTCDHCQCKCHRVRWPVGEEQRRRPSEPGHIRKRGNSYQVLVYAEVDPLTGKPLYLPESPATKVRRGGSSPRLLAQVDAQRNPRTKRRSRLRSTPGFAFTRPRSPRSRATAAAPLAPPARRTAPGTAATPAEARLRACVAARAALFRETRRRRQPRSGAVDHRPD